MSLLFCERSLRALQYDVTLTASDGFVTGRKIQWFYFSALNLLNVVYNVTVTKTEPTHTVMLFFSPCLWTDWELHCVLLDCESFFNRTLSLSKGFEMSHIFRAENRPVSLLNGQSKGAYQMTKVRCRKTNNSLNRGI